MMRRQAWLLRVDDGALGGGIPARETGLKSRGYGWLTG